MKLMKTLLVFATAAFVSVTIPCKLSGEAIGSKTITTRDTYGIWHIKTPNRKEAFEAMGYAIAEDRLWQLELFRRSSKGLLAELFGPEFVELDVYTRTIGYSQEEIQAAYNALSYKYKSIIQSYVNGINSRISLVTQNETLLPIEFKALGLVPTKWDVTDVLSFQVYMMRSFDCEALYSGQMDNAALLQELAAKFPENYYKMYSDLRWQRDPKSQTMISGKATPSFPRRKVPAKFKTKLNKAGNALNKLRHNNIEKLKKINAYIKMGSYAWAVSGRKTASGNPILYSGPEMGFSTPAVVTEGSIETCGYNVSGMLIPGIPAVIIGRTKSHAWSMQVGHAHTVDFYIEDSNTVKLHRYETIKVAGTEDIILPVFRTSHGPVVYPMPYNPAVPADTIVSWKYSHWNDELSTGIKALIEMGSAHSLNRFGKAVNLLPVSQHICYINRRGDIAYWMSGKDPVRMAGVDTTLPQLGDGSQEWQCTNKKRPHAVNPEQGFFAGWNNKACPDYDNPNVLDVFYFGPFHRAHVMQDYFKNKNNLTYEQIRDFAINASTTDSFALGGTPWKAIEEYFRAAIDTDPSPERLLALELLDNWNGHIVDGKQSDWAENTVYSDAWVLEQEWILEVIRLTFYDELQTQTMTGDDHHPSILFNALVHALENDPTGVVNQYNWFQNTSDTGPSSADEIIVKALDNTLEKLGARPWNKPRKMIIYNHDILGPLGTTLHANRSTYAQCVEMGHFGPVRIESMFPLGQSGEILGDFVTGPVFNPNFFSLKPLYDLYIHKSFQLFFPYRSKK